MSKQQKPVGWTDPANIPCPAGSRAFWATQEDPTDIPLYLKSPKPGEPVAEVDFGRTRSISWLAPLNNLPNHAKLYLQPGRDHKFERWMVDELIELAGVLPEDIERINRIAAAIASLFEDPTP